MVEIYDLSSVWASWDNFQPEMVSVSSPDQFIMMKFDLQWAEKNREVVRDDETAYFHS